MTATSIDVMLKKVPFFQHFPQELLEELVEIGKLERRERGVAVFLEGDAPDCMYMILSGRVEMQKRTPDGQEVGLVTLQVGDFFGEMALVDGAKRSATARTLEACELYRITRDKFTEMLSQSPQLIPAVLASVVSKIRTRAAVRLNQLCPSAPTN